MNVKIALVIRAGLISGRMIEKKIRRCPAPSMRAASSMSRGMLRMNCTIRNTKNASVARNFGRISGQYVSTSSSLLNMMYCGMIITWNGSSSVPIIAANRMPTPRNWIRANAYAASAEESTVPITAMTR